MQSKTAVCRIFFTSECQCRLFSNKNPIIRIFGVYGGLADAINQDKFSSAVLLQKRSQEIEPGMAQ